MMKNSKLISILKERNIVVPLYLLQNYKELKIKIEEFIFLMYLDNLGDKSLFDPKRFAVDLNISNKDVMNYINVLSDKNLITVKTIKTDKGLMEEQILLDGFYNKLSLLVMNDINENDSKKDTDIYELIQKEFGRTLGTIEIEIINAWLDNNISEELIIEALKEAVFNGVFNLKYIDKILYEWGKDGIKTVKDVEERRKKRNSKKEEKTDIDLDIVDWNWFDE
ncbi:MAG: DnaD domain protein [Bacilli bacterium]|nr:DnaD domain protein [Bacilli bacterium]